MKPIKINTNLKLESKVVTLNEIPVIYVTLLGNYQNNDYCKAWSTLWKYVKESGLFTPEIDQLHSCGDVRDAIASIEKIGIAHICIYHDDPKITAPEHLRTDACLTLPKALKPKGDIGAKILKAGKYAVFTYQGSYMHLGEVYDTIYGKYIPDNAFTIDERPGFECYLNDPQNTSPENLLTDIYVPIL